MKTALLLATALLPLALASQARAYGQLSFENAVIKQVSCDYRPVEISIHEFDRVTHYEMLQNLVPMTIEGLEVSTRSNGERRVGTRHLAQLSINGVANSFLSTKAKVTDTLKEVSPNGATLQRTYFVDAASFRAELIQDKIAGCQLLARAAKDQRTLAAPLKVSHVSQVKVVKAPYDLQGKSEMFDSTPLVFQIPMGEKLKNLIRKNATCIADTDGVGFLSAHLADGTKVDRCD